MTDRLKELLSTPTFSGHELCKIMDLARSRCEHLLEDGGLSRSRRAEVQTEWALASMISFIAITSTGVDDFVQMRLVDWRRTMTGLHREKVIIRPWDGEEKYWALPGWKNRLRVRGAIERKFRQLTDELRIRFDDYGRERTLESFQASSIIDNGRDIDPKEPGYMRLANRAGLTVGELTAFLDRDGKPDPFSEDEAEHMTDMALVLAEMDEEDPVQSTARLEAADFFALVSQTGLHPVECIAITQADIEEQTDSGTVAISVPPVRGAARRVAIAGTVLPTILSRIRSRCGVAPEKHLFNPSCLNRGVAYDRMDRQFDEISDLDDIRFDQRGRARNMTALQQSWVIGQLRRWPEIDRASIAWHAGITTEELDQFCRVSPGYVSR